VACFGTSVAAPGAMQCKERMECVFDAVGACLSVCIYRVYMYAVCARFLGGGSAGR